MMTFAVLVLALTVLALSLYVLHRAAAFARSGGENAAADPAPLVAPLRLVTHDERHERLVTAAMRRHPAGSRRPQMSPPAEGMATPGAAVGVATPGVVSKP